MPSFALRSTSASPLISTATLVVTLGITAHASARAPLPPPPARIPAALQTRISAALAKLNSAQAGLATSQPELAKHRAAAESALQQFRNAPKSAAPATLTASLSTAKAEYAAALAQVTIVLKQTTDVRDAHEELKQILPPKSASADLLKATGASSFADENAKWQRAASATGQAYADQAALNAAAALVDSALAAPAPSPGQCDIRKADWANMKYPATEAMPSFQLKRGEATLDGGDDPMNGGRVSWGFTLVQVGYADTDKNGVTEAFVRISESGAGYQQMSHELLFAFEDDTNCKPKPLANAELSYSASATRMTTSAFLETNDEGGGEWRLSGKRVIRTAVGAPLPVCQAGLPPGTFKKGNLTLIIPSNCTDAAGWYAPKQQHLSRPGVAQEIVDGQSKAILYTLEGDVCFRYLLTPSKSGGITLTWQPDPNASMDRNPQVVHACTTNNGEYRLQP